MKVLVLSPYPERLAEALADDQVVAAPTYASDIIDLPAHRYDFIISYGYRHILRQPALSLYKNRIINLHIGYLPWNRGADPNFWSWFDGTYKGVTIHHVDSGLDTGPLIARRLLSPPNTMTLREVYDLLHHELVALFTFHWPRIKHEAGTMHRAKDIDPFFAQLSHGWDTPCREVEEMGRKWREEP